MEKGPSLLARAPPDGFDDLVSAERDDGADKRHVCGKGFTKDSEDDRSDQEND